jgi:hypothetical protein
MDDNPLGSDGEMLQEYFNALVEDPLQDPALELTPAVTENIDPVALRDSVDALEMLTCWAPAIVTIGLVASVSTATVAEP